MIIEVAILSSIAVSFLSVLLVRNLISKPERLVACVYLKETLRRKIDLSSLDENGEIYTLTISDSEYLKIHAKHDSICVKESSCPGQECVRQGYISMTNQVILCAHYGVYITITGAPNNVVEI